MLFLCSEIILSKMIKPECRTALLKVLLDFDKDFPAEVGLKYTYINLERVLWIGIHRCTYVKQTV